MKIVQVVAEPSFFPDQYPKEMVQALVGLSFEFDFEKTAQVFRQHSELDQPATNYLPVPIGNILEAFGKEGEFDIMEKWRQTGVPILAIPVQCCQPAESCWF